MKKKTVIISICIAFIGVIFYFIFSNQKVRRLEPVSGLTYEITRKNDFKPIVTKLTNEETEVFQAKINQQQEQEKYQNPVTIYTGNAVYDAIFKKLTNQYGIEYTREWYEECYASHVASLDENANQGKQLISCSDNYGSQQDKYYVYLDNGIYLFTTPFPTRILYHDPYFGSLPERISMKGFQEIIESLK